MWITNLLKVFSRSKPTLAEVLTPTSRPAHSQLSDPLAQFEKKGIKAWRIENNPDTFPYKTRAILTQHSEARDNKKVFLQAIKKEYWLHALEVESWYRYWRKVQQHYPDLRGASWETRQSHAKNKAHEFSQPI